jgi:hypothetical protein
MTQKSEMDTVIDKLSAKGFIVNKMGKDCGLPVCYMSRKRGATTHYAEVDHLGKVNGVFLGLFLKGL